MSVKNTLQEYYQKKGLSVPVYSTAHMGGDPHKPIFVSEVELPDGEKYIGNPKHNKKDAEIDAASQALKHIEEMAIDEKKTVVTFSESPPSSKNYLLVDMDSVPLRKSIKIPKSFIVRGFSGKIHSLPKDAIESIPIKMGRDAVDTAIIMYASRLMERELTENIYILSGDHFASTLVDIAFQWKKKITITHLDSLESLRSVIKSF